MYLNAPVSFEQLKFQVTSVYALLSYATGLPPASHDPKQLTSAT
jgi:hypothetical protein